MPDKLYFAEKSGNNSGYRLRFAAVFAGKPGNNGFFYSRTSCSPLSSALSSAPAAGRFLDL